SVRDQEHCTAVRCKDLGLTQTVSPAPPVAVEQEHAGSIFATIKKPRADFVAVGSRNPMILEQPPRHNWGWFFKSWPRTSGQTKSHGRTDEQPDNQNGHNCDRPAA